MVDGDGCSFLLNVVGDKSSVLLAPASHHSALKCIAEAPQVGEVDETLKLRAIFSSRLDAAPSAAAAEDQKRRTGRATYLSAFSQQSTLERFHVK
ncbi:unnamed protein product [Mesocestoides corti]|uniref:Uncharacterized protein n=1 Tax=Mesocestoides corti TaxID=53468 RepID=A0A0R3UDT6_MESCO|nr:unnamed protein product [Mesocestoides corti]